MDVPSPIPMKKYFLKKTVKSGVLTYPHVRYLVWLESHHLNSREFLGAAETAFFGMMNTWGTPALAKPEKKSQMSENWRLQK